MLAEVLQDTAVVEWRQQTNPVTLLKLPYRLQSSSKSVEDLKQLMTCHDHHGF